MNRKPMSPGDWVIAALFAATIVVVTAQVVWRYAFNNSLVWTEELSRYLFVWMTFVGAALAVKESSHIRVSLLVDCLPARVRRWLAIGCLLLTAAFLAFLIISRTKQVFAQPKKSQPTYRTSAIKTHTLSQ